MPTTTSQTCIVHSSSGAAAFSLNEFSGQEQISGLFRFDCKLTADNSEVDFTQLLGHDMCVEMQMDDGESRYFHGIVSRFSQEDDPELENVYYAELVPSLWLGTLNSNCRIFHDKSVLDIVKAVFADLNVTEVDDNTTGSYDPIPYCVQYRESDFNFVSRLLETAGIAYYFCHEEAKHTMVLADSPSANLDCPVQSAVAYQHSESSGAGTVQSWHVERELRPGVRRGSSGDPCSLLQARGTEPRRDGSPDH